MTINSIITIEFCEHILIIQNLQHVSVCCIFFFFKDNYFFHFRPVQTWAPSVGQSCLRPRDDSLYSPSRKRPASKQNAEHLKAWRRLCFLRDDVTWIPAGRHSVNANVFYFFVFVQSFDAFRKVWANTQGKWTKTALLPLDFREPEREDLKIKVCKRFLFFF